MLLDTAGCISGSGLAIVLAARFMGDVCRSCGGYLISSDGRRLGRGLLGSAGINGRGVFGATTGDSAFAGSVIGFTTSVIKVNGLVILGPTLPHCLSYAAAIEF